MNVSRSQYLHQKIEKLSEVTTRSMFGYECYSVNGKFFVGFSKKKSIVIVRLSKELQQKAIQEFNSIVKPFSHGAKMGWIEFNINALNEKEAFRWIKEGYARAKALA